MDESPVQLTFLGVKELHVETFWPVSLTSNYTPEDGVIQHAIGAFDTEKRTVQVKLRFISGKRPNSPEEVKQLQDQNRQPFLLRAEVVGEFTVAPNSIPEAEVPQWAQKSVAPILMPFLREQVYALSLRVGVQPILIPLVLASPYVNVGSGKEPAVKSRLIGGETELRVPSGASPIRF